MSRSRHWLSQLPSFALLCLFLQACGSSVSGAGSQTVVPFSNPIDASKLSAALVTEEPAVASEAHWDCNIPDANQRIAYRFVSDGSGVETDLNNAGSESNFIWEATSANTMTTTVTGSGLQIDLTEIQFVSQNSIELIVSGSLAMQCSLDDGDNQTNKPVDIPDVDNALVYEGVNHPLTHGFEEVYTYDPKFRDDTHRRSQFQVADSSFSLTQVTVGLGGPVIFWNPDDATVWLRADIHAPGPDIFQSATFEIESNDVDDRGPEVAGKYYFNKARFGFDRDGVDRIDSDSNEFQDVVAGTITITRGAESQATMSFDVTLEDGERMVGSFSGLFVEYVY